MKELTFAVRKQQQALEERLEACLEELRALCLREAVSLGGRCWHTHTGGYSAEPWSPVLGCWAEGREDFGSRVAEWGPESLLGTLDGSGPKG